MGLGGVGMVASVRHSSKDMTPQPLGLIVNLGRTGAGTVRLGAD